MAKESIMRIVEAENEAQSTLAHADDKCAQLLRDAKTEANRIVDQAHERAQKRVDARIAEAKSAAAVIDKSVSNEAKIEAERLKKSAAASHDRALKLVIDALVSRA